MAYQNNLNLIEAYFLNHKDISLALRWYRERYPDRHTPSRFVLKRLVDNLTNLGRFDHRLQQPQQQIINVSDDELNILIYFEAYPKSSVREGEEEIGVSKSRIHRVLKKYKFKSYVEGRLVQKLRPGDAERRLNFCQHIERLILEDQNFLNTIIWTDESNFSNNGMYNRRNNRIWSRQNPLRIRETNDQVRFSFNCWCGIVSNRVLLIHFYEGTLNTERYLEILEILRNEINNLPDADRRNLIFQQDGAPAHNSRRTAEFLNEYFPSWIGTFGQIRWPPRSPDLTPLDFFLWGYVKDLVYRNRYNSVQELQNEVKRIISNIHHAKISKSTGREIIKRVRICIQQNGSHFEHLIN